MGSWAFAGGLRRVQECTYTGTFSVEAFWQKLPSQKNRPPRKENASDQSLSSN